MLILCSCQTPAQTIILYSSALQLCCWVNNLGAVFHKNIMDPITPWWITLKLILLPPLKPEVNITRFSTLPLSISVIYHLFYWIAFSVGSLKLLLVTQITEQHQSVLHHSWKKTPLSKSWRREMSSPHEAGGVKSMMDPSSEQYPRNPSARTYTCAKLHLLARQQPLSVFEMLSTLISNSFFIKRHKLFSVVLRFTALPLLALSRWSIGMAEIHGSPATGFNRIRMYSHAFSCPFSSVGLGSIFQFSLG